MLRGLQLPRSPPLLPHLLAPRATGSGAPRLAMQYARGKGGGGGGGGGGGAPDLDALLDETLEEFGLNDEQQRVLRQVRL